MKLEKVFGLSSVLCLSAMPLAAQDTNQVEQLKKQLQQLKENYEKSQQQQRDEIDALKKQIDALGQSHISAPVVESKGWSPSQPITVGRGGSAYMNVSFDALMDVGGSTARDPSAQLQLGDHDPIQRGFSLRNAEIALDGAVDPYFKGFANIVLKLEKNQDTTIELEEAYLQSTSLPANLQLKGGQFFANFGRQNPQHPHQWAFVDQPLILTRAFGPDGLRNLGAQGSWLLPTSFYSEFSLGVLNGEGETAFNFRNPDGFATNGIHGRPPVERALRGPGDLLFVPRLAASVDVTDNQTILAGASAALGPNDSGATERTQIYGLDLYW